MAAADKPDKDMPSQKVYLKFTPSVNTIKDQLNALSNVGIEEDVAQTA